jgi:PhnB protein
MVQPIPEGYHTLTPTLAFKDARKAIEFYKRAFGAVEKDVIPGPNGKGVMHGEIRIGNSMIMLGDETPDGACPSAETVGQATASFALYVRDADQTFKNAIAAGAKVDKPMADMFWGDRAGSVNDPFGYTWWILTHVHDVSTEEMVKAAHAQSKAHSNA